MREDRIEMQRREVYGEHSEEKIKTSALRRDWRTE